jgi:hypothetical protein
VIYRPSYVTCHPKRNICLKRYGAHCRSCLSVAPSDATPEQVIADAFASLGYLPDEAKQAGLKILAKAEDKA